MICVKCTAFYDLRADLRIRLAALCKSVRKFWFCKLALTCVESVWPGFKAKFGIYDYQGSVSSTFINQHGDS